jgi:hypothetical protein
MSVRYAIRCEVCAVEAQLVGQMLSVLSAQVTAFRAVHDHDARGCAIDSVPAPVGDALPVATSAPAEQSIADYEVIAADGRRWWHVRRGAAA